MTISDSSWSTDELPEDLQSRGKRRQEEIIDQSNFDIGSDNGTNY